MKHINEIKMLLLLLLIFFGILAVSRPAEADETTYIIERYEITEGSNSVVHVIERLLEHDRNSMESIKKITQRFGDTYLSNEKVLIRLDYVEARAFHLKGWIVGIKKLKNLKGRSFFQTGREYVFVKDWRSSEGRQELDGLYNGVQFLLVISGDKAGKTSNMEARLQNLGDRVMLMEVCEYYRLMDDINSLRRVKRSEKELNTAFNKNLVFLSQELKHLKNWYVKHARQG